MFYKFQIFLSLSSQFNMLSWYVKYGAQCSSFSCAHSTAIFFSHKDIMCDKTKSWNQDNSETSYPFPQASYPFRERSQMDLLRTNHFNLTLPFTTLLSSEQLDIF